MNSLLLAMVLSCPPTEIVNVSKYPWDSHDRKMLKQAKKRCGELYEDAPCVKLFRKFEEQSYTVICGEENK